MSSMLTADILRLLDPAGPAPLVIVTIGNDWRGDDGIAPYIASRLRDRSRPGCALVDAGEWPEEALDRVVALKPARVVLVDAADFGGSPGEARLIPRASIPNAVLSTHRFPPAALAGLIEADTGAPVVFLGIQAVTVGLGTGLSEAVRQTGDAIVACLEKSSISAARNG